MHAPVREPAEVGELTPLTRTAMLERMDRALARTAESFKTLQEVAPRDAVAPREVARADSGRQADNLPAAPRAQSDPRADLGAARVDRPFAVTALFPHQRVPPDRRNVAVAGDGVGLADTLKDVRGELQSIRAEIAAMSRLLGRPVRTSAPIENQGILQQYDQLDSNRRLDVFRREDTVAEGRAAIADERRELRTRDTEQLVREIEIQRIERRQRDLLLALRRAEDRLSEAPEDLPPGLRDSIIGQIYRARYSIALFGGTYGGAGVTGLLYNATA